MTDEVKFLPAGSQTVGPYFRIGLEYLIDRTPAVQDARGRTIQIHGKVLDRDGAPVPDAMLEFWAADPDAEGLSSADKEHGFPRGFRRVATDGDGQFVVATTMPAAVTDADGRRHASHMLVLVFARGLLRHLISRVYFGGEQDNADDLVLQHVPAERRRTLIAECDPEQPGVYRWNVVLQGKNETVFFKW